MFAEFLIQNKFYEEYMHLYAVRFSISSFEMENLPSQITFPEHSIELYNNLKAFMNIIKKNTDKITPYDLIDIADDVNRDINFFQKGYRKTQVEVKKATHFFPLPAKDIPMKMYSIFDAYHNVWRELPIYEREARLHIELVRLQPFEDGNKRAIRILTNYNLCKQNKAPVVINSEENDQYFSYIDDYNIDDFSKFLEKKSKEELQVMLNLYRSICGTDDFSMYATDPSDGNIMLSDFLSGYQKKKE